MPHLAVNGTSTLCSWLSSRCGSWPAARRRSSPVQRRLHNSASPPVLRSWPVREWVTSPSLLNLPRPPSPKHQPLLRRRPHRNSPNASDSHRPPISAEQCRRAQGHVHGSPAGHSTLLPSSICGQYASVSGHCRPTVARRLTQVQAASGDKIRPSAAAGTRAPAPSSLHHSTPGKYRVFSQKNP